MAISNLWFASLEHEACLALDAHDKSRARAIGFECMRRVGMAIGGDDEKRVYEVFDDLRGNSGQLHRISTHTLLQGALRGLGGPEGMHRLFQELAEDKRVWQRASRPTALGLTDVQRQTFEAFLGFLSRMARRLE